MDYNAFIKSKSRAFSACGFDVSDAELNPKLFDFQRAIVKWALRKGRAAIFADCGMGKTPMQLEWARHVADKTGGRVLILAPLAVAQQTVREGAEKFNIKIDYCREQNDSTNNIIITNYEMLEHFNVSEFAGIVLDESSILKAYTGKIRNRIIESFSKTKYRLACTATPAPNDYMELGNHSEFLGVMTRSEMLSMYFVHDGGETQKWRVKGHAESVFFKWVASWAIMIRKPSDLGFDDTNFQLPPIEFINVKTECDNDTIHKTGYLLNVAPQDLDMRRKLRRASLGGRVEEAIRIANNNNGPFIIWCDLNDESRDAAQGSAGAAEVTGAMPNEMKTAGMIGFVNGTYRGLVSKPTICGFGMNFQHCSTVIFLGLSDSYEKFYQAIRRCWRFGQKNKVTVYIVTSDAESSVVQNIQRKEKEAAELAEGMVEHMKNMMREEVFGSFRNDAEYKEKTVKTDRFELRLGDCIEHIKTLADDSIHYTIFSPPFASLYTYSDSERDMGNCVNHAEFFEHFDFLVKELLRVTMPGRLLSFHCMNLPTSKSRDGVIGITDFRGELIRRFVSAGFIYHSEVCIWKDPVTAMQRTKAVGLLYKQLRKDSCISRQGIPDYLVTMRKPGENPERVTKTHEGFPVDLWQQYASPVWMDINPSNTLQKKSAREEEDERHICPLQLDVIERAVDLWTNPGDLILSPFAGIGSEGYVAVKRKRRFLGFELKQSYFEQAAANLAIAEKINNQKSLFEMQC